MCVSHTQRFLDFYRTISTITAKPIKNHCSPSPSACYNMNRELFTFLHIQRNGVPECLLHIGALRSQWVAIVSGLMVVHSVTHSRRVTPLVEKNAKSYFQIMLSCYNLMQYNLMQNAIKQTLLKYLL